MYSDLLYMIVIVFPPDRNTINIMFQSNIKSETTYLQNEDCFYARQNTSMRGKVVTHTLLIVIILLEHVFQNL